MSAAEGTIMQPLSIHQIMKMTNAQLVARLVQEQVLFVSLFLVLQLSFYSARMPNSHMANVPLLLIAGTAGRAGSTVYFIQAGCFCTSKRAGCQPPSGTNNW